MAESKIPTGAARLSTYPAAKILVGCHFCGWEAQYDKQAMLLAGGDRALTHMLDAIAKRKGCPRQGKPASPYERCEAHYLNLVGNDYARAKGV